MTDLPETENPRRLYLSCTRHPAAPRIFTLARAKSSNSPRVRPFYFINCISEPSPTPRHTRSFSILSRHTFCLLMTGHQLLSSLNYLCSQAVALSRLVLTGLCVSSSASKDRQEGTDDDGDAADSMNTNGCLYLPTAAAAAALEGLAQDS